MELTQENFLYAIIFASFFMGAVSCRVATRLFEISHAAKIVHSTIYRCLLMCAKIHEDIEFLMEIKRKHLTDVGMDTHKISNFCEIDRQAITNWKESVVQRMILHAPPTFSFVIKFSNWREAMRQLDDMHEKN